MTAKKTPDSKKTSNTKPKATKTAPKTAPKAAPKAAPKNTKTNAEETALMVAQKSNLATRELVEDVLGQLKKLGTLREEEIQRQKEFVTQFRVASERQKSIQKMIFYSAAAIVAVGLLIWGGVRKIKTGQETLATNLTTATSEQAKLTDQMGIKVEAVSKTFNEVSQKQNKQIDGVMDEPTTTRIKQSGMSRLLTDEMANAKEIIAQASSNYLDGASDVLKQLSTTTTLQQLSNYPPTTLQQLSNNSPTTLQQLSNNHPTTPQRL